jgi:hypothetical protein
MLLLFMLAVGAAVAQHNFYTYLNDQIVDDVAISQAWAIRVGNGFAFLFKTTLVAAIAIAFCQRFWYSVRQKAVRIGSLDAMFSVLGDPLQFLNRDLLSKTKLLCAVAAVAWVVPISAIFSPGALTGRTLVVSLNGSHLLCFHRRQ